jgi:hypothetical protein
MKSDLTALIFVFAISIAATYGWICNIIALVHMLDGDITAMFIARCVGVFMAPLGSILGFM